MCAQVPIGTDSSKWVDVRLRIALVNMGMDFLAKTKMGPTANSTSEAALA